MESGKDKLNEFMQDKEKLIKFYELLALNLNIDFYDAVQIYCQNPTVKIVKTYDEWHEKTTRKIKKGSKGIAVVDQSNPKYKKHYFDISQTYGFRELVATDFIGDSQLLAAIKAQCILSHEVQGDFKDKLCSAVMDFVDETIASEYENFRQELSNGVMIFLVSKFNKPKDFISFKNNDLDSNNKLRAIRKAHQLATYLTKQILQFRSIENEKKTQIKQFEKIRVANQKPFDGEQSTIVSSTDIEQLTIPVSNQTSKASRENIREFENTIEKQKSIAKQEQLFSQRSIFEEYRPSGTRDVDGTIHLQDSKVKQNYTPQNYKLTESDFEIVGGLKARYKQNIDAIKLVKELQSTKTQATTDQQKILAKYKGWGGIPQAFDNLNKDWAKEYNELKNILTEKKYESARSSTLSAFFTPKVVIDSMYQALAQMGLTSGTLLEPALGKGNFLGLRPDGFSPKIIEQTAVHGVELDQITGAIAKQLYPENVNIHVKGFENTNFMDNSFDCVLTNVPFGNYSVHDTKYNKYNLNIHDYFIIKSLDKVREGGIVAVVTTKGTLDKVNDSARRLMAERGLFLGAIRLPNNAFKDNANTKVTSDILFFQKVDPITANRQNLDWLSSYESTDKITYNQYFQLNKQMVLGKMQKGKSMYGGEDEVTCEPDGRDLKELLANAIKFLPKNIYKPKMVFESNKSKSDYFNQQKLTKLLENTKNYCYAIGENQKIYMRIDDEMIEQNVIQSNKDKLLKMIYLREQVRKILDIQVQGCGDDWLQYQQYTLHNMYTEFTNKFGYLNAKPNKNIFKNDADSSLLFSLENYDEATNIATKTDIFDKRTIKKYVRPTHADTAIDALKICKNEIGKVDIKVLEQLTSKTFEQIITELDGEIYRNPSLLNEQSSKYDGWETVTEYLSGNVVQKLEVAKIISKQDNSFEKNVKALEEVQPTLLTASDISVRLGASWIDADIYKEFVTEKFKLSPWHARQLKLDFNKFTQRWKLQVPQGTRYSFENTNIYGTSRLGGHAIFEYAINLQTPNVYDKITDANGKEKRILNKQETIAVREKLRKIQDEFKAWIFDEPKRREQLVAEYNKKFNNIKLAEYDGSYLDFPEMNPLYELKDYQKNAVERIITNGNTLLHHVVGAGKTFEIIASAMKLRQMKLASKPMIVVPNHLVLQWSQAFRELYPQANLLIATEKDFEKENRLKFISGIATGDWDSVIIAMSSFEKIPISIERQEKIISQEIQNIRQTLEDLRNEQDDNRISIKTMEKVLKTKQQALKELSSSKKDNLIKFEDLGIDYLFIDEAHNYKNRFLYTKMNNVAGISQTASKRASDLDMKIDYLSELHGGQKGVVFATGTPTSNSMVEMFTMQSYLAKQDLEQAGLHIFDNWAATFGETVTGLELAPSGKGYRSKTRFAKFTNLPELLTMYRKFADVKTSDMLNLPVPKANKHTITIKPTETILELAEVIAERAERINNGGIPAEVDNMLKVTSDGRKLALDPRCFDSKAPDDPNNKINIAAQNIYDIWKNSKVNRASQLVFCDLSTPKTDFENYNPDKDFDVYNHLKFVLVSLGVPKNEIAYIHDAKNDSAKQSLFDKVNNGKIRILIGSTQKCGAGTNVQKRLIALHHLDAPWRPADLEQRDGRAIRQGNTNTEVDIYTYVTERTFDAYSYQILENKQRFISQINNGNLTVRVAQDIDETTLTYAEIKAITSANPLIKRKQEVENELTNLKILETQYRNNRYRLQDSIAKELPNLIQNTTVIISNFEQDLLLREQNNKEYFSIKILGKTYTDRKDGSEVLHSCIFMPSNINKVIANYKGFEIIPEPITNFTEKSVTLKGNNSHNVSVSQSAFGTLTKIENAISGLEKGLEQQKEKLASYTNELSTAKVELTKQFEHEQKLSSLSIELEEINAQLNLDKNEIEVVIDDEVDNNIPKIPIQNIDLIKEKLNDKHTLTSYEEREKISNYAM